jgi:hypothetical protein
MGRPNKTRSDTHRGCVSSDGSNHDKLDEILEKFAFLDSITRKLSNLENMMAATQAENKELKEKVSKQNDCIMHH